MTSNQLRNGVSRNEELGCNLRDDSGKGSGGLMMGKDSGGLMMERLIQHRHLLAIEFGI